MDDKDKKGGFAGLSDLTSDIQDIVKKSEGKIDNRTAAILRDIQDIVQKAEGEPQKKVFDLIDLSRWPTLPSPWSSTDEGQTWVWGDFFFTFQKNPPAIIDILNEADGKKREYKGMNYFFSMTAYYRLDKNPMGPSHRPIMVIAIEQANLSQIRKIMAQRGEQAPLFEGGKEIGPPMIGLFAGEARSNLGHYEDEISAEPVRQTFFKILGDKLGLSGQPRMIGNIDQAHGHPETGLPEMKKKSGCSPKIFLIIAVIAILIAIWLFGGSDKKDDIPSQYKAPSQSVSKSAKTAQAPKPAPSDNFYKKH